MRNWSLEYDGSLVMDGQVVGQAPAPDTASKQERLEIAHLIVAAPQMYDELRDIIYFLENFDKQNDAFDTVRLVRLKMAKAVIARARGDK